VIGDAAFIGDTLFMPDYGTARADCPDGDAHILYRSIRRILVAAAPTKKTRGWCLGLSASALVNGHRGKRR